jgi:NADH-quinone oxidoreductase subunit E
VNVTGRIASERPGRGGGDRGDLTPPKGVSVSVKFSEKTMKEFEAALARYPDRQAAVLPALWLVQRDFGFVSTEGALYVADLTGTPPAKVLETLRFYTMYRKERPGRFHVQVCRTLSCMLSGSEDLRKVLERKLGLKPGGVTEDGKFSYQQVECLAACHNAPCVQVNDDYHEGLTPEAFERLLDELAQRKG